MNEEGGLNLGKSLGVIRRQLHVVIGISILVAGAAALKAWLEPPLFKSRFELLTEPVTLETQVISSTNSQTLSSREEIVSVEADELKLKILKNPKILSPILEKLQDKYPNLNEKSLQRSLVLTTILKSSKSGNILEVTYQHNNKNQVQDVLNEVANTYLKYSLDARQSDINQGIVFLDRQLPILREKVDQLQNKLQGLRQENNLIDPVAQAELLSAQLDKLNQEQQGVRVELAETRMLAASQQQGTSKLTQEISASVLETPRYQDLRKEILAIDVELAKQSAVWTEKNPEIQFLQEKRQNLRSLLDQESKQIGEEIQSRTSQRILELTLRDKALTQAIKGLELKIKLLSVTTRKYVDLQRELNIVTDNLTQFITKREALKIDAAQQQVPWEMLTPPHEPEALSSSIKRNLLLGTILGLLLGIASAMGLDKLSNLIYTPEEIYEIMNVPILGIIPFNKKVENTEVNHSSGFSSRNDMDTSYADHSNLLQLNSTSAFTEAFNSLYTNLCLLTPDNPIGSLVISSAGPEEGKSTVTLYLGLTAAGMGRRVLLVDTNLRNPKLHERVGLMNVLGLSDLIYRNNLDPHSIIQRSGRDDNLFVLTCGQLPPDPIRLLSSEKMKSLMKRLHDSFDLVIYDAPCLIGLADTHLLANQTDGVVLVTALGQIQTSELENAQEQLALSRTQIWGIVANKSHSVSGFKSRFLLKEQSPPVGEYLR